MCEDGKSRLKVETESAGEKPLAAYLVGVRRSGESMADAEEHIEELEQLAITFGVPIVGQEVVTLREPNVTYLLGEGKVRQIHQTCLAVGADVIIVDDDLSPSQQRNWERQTKLAVIDRREVILGIFADRAQTKEARLQVRLARAEYSLPRLTRAWTHLERQRGGGGARGGAGEAQLEVDRRLVRNQISSLKRELEHVRRVRATQRKTRTRIPIPTAALVGYTNAGKSSLLNALTGATVLEEDKLFATLDPTTRKMELPNGQTVLLTDTVGFIRKLPHALVEAFKATLEEAQLSTMLVHVLDASHPTALGQREATEGVLKELGALNKPTILVLNKIDLLQDKVDLDQLRAGYDFSVETSTVTGQGLEDLKGLIAEIAGHDLERVRVKVPPNRYDIVSMIHREGQVEQESHEEDNTIVDAILPRKFHSRIAEFLSD